MGRFAGIRSFGVGPSAMGRVVVGAALLALLGGCGASRASQPDRSAELLSTAQPRSTACAPETAPETLPAADVLVDSAAVIAAVRELRRGDLPAAGYVLLTLAFDAEGVNVRRDLLEHDTSPTVADSVQRIVFAARRQVEQTDAEFGVRLRIDLDDPVTTRVGRREFCPPVARDRAVDAAMHTFNPAGVRYRRGARERVLHVEVLVTEIGTVSTARIVRGELSGSALERSLTEYLRQFLFTPATVDSVPTRAWIQIPVRVPA